MRKNLLFLLLFIICSSTTIAQSKTARITGQVLDDSGKPLQGATISLLRQADSALFKTAVTGKDGRY